MSGPAIGAALGAGAGLVALAVECLLLGEHGPLRIATTLVLAATSAGAGAGVGALCAAVARRAPPARAAGGALAAGGAALVASVWLHQPPRPDLPPPASAPRSRPWVVLVSLDTVRADHLSLYGYERDTSPRLEAFAGTATVYTRAVASSDLTLSTHASLFTGLYARHHGARVDARDGARALAPEQETLAEILQRAGYLTLGVVGNSGYLGRRWGFDQGFDHYDDRAPLPLFPEQGGHRLVRALARPGGGSVVFRRAEQVNRDVFALLERIRGRPEPVFLFVNYMDPHWPYEPPPPFDRRYPGRLADPEDAPTQADIRAIRALARPLRPEERAHLLSQYDGELAYTDRQLGALLDHLEALGRFESSLIVVTSDHGEALGEHQHLEHGVSVYENQVHVPLLVKAPHQREPRVVEARVSSVDLLPTILDGLGLPVPRGLTGLSVLAGTPPEGRAIVAESYPSPLLYREHRRYRRIARAVYSGDLKLIASSTGERELYDVGADPAEQRDLRSLAGSAAGQLEADLEARLQAWLDARPSGRGARAEVDPETRRRLRELGYVE